MPETGFLATRPVHHRHSMAPAAAEEVTAAAATAETREHLGRGHHVEATADGAVLLVETGISFEPFPVALPRFLSADMAAQLLLVATGPARAVRAARGLAVEVAGGVVPPAAMNRHVRHGYLAVGLDCVVTLGIAGAVALEWRRCRSAGVPAGQQGDRITAAVARHLV
ncbi:hypothetical protein [Streptomyces salinarius]|uniref:hypothetical protein n=1 Tax=Streptomyces salinarius TaxID=2762598 RepID=UPI0028526CA8|nr:hypothetical protein [Streptomyces salinarius]